MGEIVLATRIGERSVQPAEAARRLAEQFGAGITLVHVTGPVSVAELSSAEAGYLPEERRQALRDMAEEQLQRFAAEHLAGVRVQTRILEDDVAQSVAAVAHEVGADYIVVGTRGRGALARLVLGDTTHAILQLTPCPVVVVPLRDEPA